MIRGANGKYVGAAAARAKFIIAIAIGALACASAIYILSHSTRAMAFARRNMALFSVPASRWFGESLDTARIPHVICETINGGDVTTGAPVTTQGAQTLDNKTFIADRTWFIDGADPPGAGRARFDVATATGDVIVRAVGSGTIVLPDAGGGEVGMLIDAPIVNVSGRWIFSDATPSLLGGAINVAGAINAGGVIHAGDMSESDVGFRIYAASGGPGPFSIGFDYTRSIAPDQIGRLTLLCGGTAHSTSNSGEIIFASAGDGHADNRVEIGVYNHAGMLNVYGDHVSISGELRVDGATHLSALAVGGDAEITGDVSTDGSITAGEPITAASTAASTSPATGALVVAGGAGIGGDLYIGGAIHGNLAIARGSITSTWMGFEIPGLSTQTIYYRKNYGVATLCTLDRFEGVKDADGFPIEWFPGLLGQVVLPAEFRPADTSISTIVVSEGGEMKIASVTVLTDGRIIIRRADWSAWTPGASIVINPWCISYAVPE